MRQLKLTASNDFTVAHIDFLDLKRLKEGYEGPRLPMTFLISGDGSFQCPYQMNLQDPLLQSVYLLNREVLYERMGRYL